MIHKAEIEGFQTLNHSVDLCVIGGGMAGMLTAISAARHGIEVVLMQDRAMLGGNASSEVRMWIRGAHGKNMRETGILEEIALENIYRNPTMNYAYWDAILLDFVKREKNITLLLNCSCMDAEIEGDSIQSIRGWQTTTQCFHKVHAKVFADCSGDSVLAPLTGAEWRMGREPRDEFIESIAPKISDEKTMGLSCLLQARQTLHSVSFKAPTWAYSFTKEDFKNKLHFTNRNAWKHTNYWWMELGGTADTIADTEKITEELLKTAYGVWDFIKNSGYFHSKNWELDWIGTLAGKRESRRYVGQYILTQNDVEKEGHFPDTIAYGGWSMDDHNPDGFLSTEAPTIYHHAPSPYGIPLRCLFSKNIQNLTFAGRNISATHSAMSSTRVMATCGILGQALGTATAIALKKHCLPAELNEEQIELVQQTLLKDDCYIPWIQKEHAESLKQAKLTAKGNIDALFDGYTRPVGTKKHLCTCKKHAKIEIEFAKPKYIQNVRLILDSDLNRATQSIFLNGNYKRYPQKCNTLLHTPNLTIPKTLLKGIRVYADGEKILDIAENYQRLLILPIKKEVQNITLVPYATWGSHQIRIHDIDLDE